MAGREQTVWGVHGGKTGDADTIFLHGNCVALGWPEIGDLSSVPADREVFKEKLAHSYPGKRPLAIAVSAGQLYRFVFEMKIGDLVVYPSKNDRKIHIGSVESGYKYNPKDSAYPHQRMVKWNQAVPRTHFSQGALYELGAAMSFFQIRTYAEEYLTAREGKLESPLVDETLVLVAEDIEENARDFVLKRLAQELKGHPFAEFVGHLLATMGYRTRVSPEGPDGGVDVIAHRDELGFEPPIVKVQVKSTEGTIGDPIVSALYGKVGSDEFGLLVTLGSFSPQATNFARSKSNLRLIDGDELVNLVFQHYEQFDSRYKALLPLRRVYVPEPIDDSQS